MVHDLRSLRTIADLQFDPSSPLAPEWHVLLQWDRGQGYDPKPMPRKCRSLLCRACFRIEWIGEMDTPALPLGYLEEGHDYLRAMETLGLRPNACFWAFDGVTDAFVLVLITDAFDAVGPFELSKLLFKAHNVKATPTEIDPFIIRLHSPRHRVVREMDKFMPLKVGFRPTLANGSLGPEEKATFARAITRVDGLEIDGDWVYRFDKPLSTAKTADILRRFNRFQRNIDRAAA